MCNWKKITTSTEIVEEFIKKIQSIPIELWFNNEFKTQVDNIINWVYDLVNQKIKDEKSYYKRYK